MGDRFELEDLLRKIASASAQFSLPSKPKLEVTLPNSGKPRFAYALTAPFRLVRSRSQKKRDDTIDEKTRLLAHRDSLISDETPDEDEHDDPASYLLRVLAPLVSSVQRIGPRIGSLGLSRVGDVVKLFDDICGKLEQVITKLQGESDQSAYEVGEGVMHDHDLEMRNLMLSALLKKVQAERSSITISSALAPKSVDPFILHATSLHLRPKNRVSTSVSIPLMGNGRGPRPSPPYSSFVTGAQSSIWTANVIRLGSFQNSALFSSSPVAVRKLIGGKASG